MKEYNVTFAKYVDDAHKFVDGPRDEAGLLKQSFVDQLAALYNAKAVFVREGSRITGKSHEIWEAANRLKEAGRLPADLLIGRNDLQAASHRKPMSPFCALRLQRFFDFAPSIGDEVLDGLTARASRTNRLERVPFQIGEHGILPSFYRVRTGVIKAARDVLGMQKERLGAELFDTQGYELVDRMETQEKARDMFVTFDFAHQVVTGIRTRLIEAGKPAQEFDDVPYVFERVAPFQSKQCALYPIEGNVVPEERSVFAPIAAKAPQATGEPASSEAPTAQTES